MRTTLTFASAVLVTALCACSEKTPEKPDPQLGGVIPQAQLDALKKAKDVENVLQKGAEQRQEQSEQ